MNDLLKISSTVISVSILFAFLLTGCSSSADNNVSNSDTSNDISTEESSEISVLQSPQESSSANPQAVAIRAEKEYSEYVTIGEYKGLHYTPYDTVVYDDDIQNRINSIVNENIGFIEVTSRSVSEGDIVTVDYKIYQDNQQIDSYSKENYSFVVGEDGFLYEGADNSVIGKEKGDEFTFELSVPADSQLSDIAGKNISVYMTIDKVLCQGTDTFDDDFVEEYTDGEYTSVEEYKEYLKTKLKEEFEQYAEQKKYSDVWQQVVDNCTVKKYDQEYYNSYYKQLQEATTYLADNYDMGYDEFIEQYYKTDLETYAKTNIAEEYIVNTIAFNDNITVNEEQYQSFLKSYAESHSYSSVDDMMEIYSDDILQYYCLREYVIRYICDMAIADETAN